jgi:hypothetical protein
MPPAAKVVADNITRAIKRRDMFGHGSCLALLW